MNSYFFLESWGQNLDLGQFWLIFEAYGSLAKNRGLSLIALLIHNVKKVVLGTPEQMLPCYFIILYSLLRIWGRHLDFDTYSSIFKAWDSKAKTSRLPSIVLSVFNKKEVTLDLPYKLLLYNFVFSFFFPRILGQNYDFGQYSPMLKADGCHAKTLWHLSIALILLIVKAVAIDVTK